MTKQEFITLLDDSNINSLNIIRDMIAFALNTKKAKFEIIELKDGIIGFNFKLNNTHYNYTICEVFEVVFVKFQNEYNTTTGTLKKSIHTNVRFQIKLEEKLAKIERPHYALGRWLVQNKA